RGAVDGLGADRLRVAQVRAACGGVAHVADGAMAGQALEPVAAEHVRPPAHRLLHVEAVPVGGGDARGLLPAVLQRVEAEIGDVGGLGMVPHAEEPALVVELVAVELGRLSPDVAQARSSTHGPAAPRPRPAPPAPRGGSPAPPPALVRSRGTGARTRT